MVPEIQLKEVTAEDVGRMALWLEDPKLNNFWYGKGPDGEPLHIGYSPKKLLNVSQQEWDAVFKDDSRKILAIYDKNHGHIGEVQMVIESPLHEAQLFIVIGKPDLWFKHFGFAALLQLLDLAFFTYRLHRVWVDVPDYNAHALHMMERIGFLLEGHLRSTHPKDGQWHDSLVLGLLEGEYSRRRPRLVDQVTNPPG